MPINFFSRQGHTIKVNIYHESLEQMCFPETYEKLNDLCKASTTSEVILDFDGLNHISDQELTDLVRFINVLNILDHKTKKINMSPMLSTSISSRDSHSDYEILWKK